MGGTRGGAKSLTQGWMSVGLSSRDEKSGNDAGFCTHEECAFAMSLLLSRVLLSVRSSLSPVLEGQPNFFPNQVRLQEI